MTTSMTKGRRCPTLAELPSPPAGRTGWPWAVETPQAAQQIPGGPLWPLISIVTPSYNQAQFLEETIRSVLLQGYPNLEYIVMDGGSTDGSVAIIEKYAPWLSYWQSQRDEGQSAAIADGFGRSYGEIQAWLNSDDRLQPSALVRVAQFFRRHPDVVFANGDVHLIDADGRISRRAHAIRPVPIITANLGAHSWAQQGCFWRRDAYLAVGGVDRSLKFCMDRDLFLRLARSGPTRRIPGPALGDFRLHDDAKTARWVEIHQREDLLMRERYGSRFRGNPAYVLLLRVLWQIEIVKRSVRYRLIRRGLEV